MIDVTQQEVELVAARFDFGAPVARLTPHGRGLINDTFRVELADTPPRAAILQRVNTRVFKQPQQLVANLHALSAHAERHPPPNGLMVPHLYAASDGKYYVDDATLGFWRAQQFIPDTHTLHILSTATQAHSVGVALGAFHTLAATLPGPLHITLPGFHVTPEYLKYYDTVASAIASTDERECAGFVEARREFAHTLERARERGELHLRPTHGDPKVDNFLFDDSDRAISLIDLDTVQPGLIHHDLGDCLRSACNRSGESPAAGVQVQFDINIATEILRGYATTAGPSLGHHDFAYLYDAIRLIPFELGLRFFADHLAGDVYFKTSHRGHNLQRARVQFALTADIERQESELRRVIATLT